METTPFGVEYFYAGTWHKAQIRPCCNEENVVDYAVWEGDKLSFTITRHRLHAPDQWVIALQNADDEIAAEKVEAIGHQIDQHHARS